MVSGFKNGLGEEISLEAFDNDPPVLTESEIDRTHRPGWLQNLIDSIEHETVTKRDSERGGICSHGA